jgi:hypothetical protein
MGAARDRERAKQRLVVGIVRSPSENGAPEAETNGSNSTEQSDRQALTGGFRAYIPQVD